ncbi:hypothetical protein J3F83DRAFT_731707 [Trichoderma novae-zelandiae]
MYFLTEGKPDASKTKTFLMLGDFGDYETLREMAHRTPGLEVLTGSPSIGAEFPDWERTSDSTEEADDIPAVEFNQVNREEEWEQQPEARMKSATRLPSKKTDSIKQERLEPSHSDRRLGSYVIRCDHIEESWSEFPDGPTFTMDISRGKGDTLCAAYYFGVVQGTMIPSEYPNTLTTMIDEAETDSETSESEQDTPWTPWKMFGGDEVEETKDPFVQASSGGKKRKAGKASPAKATPSDANAKRRRITARPAFSVRSLHFQLRGRDTGTHEIYSDPGHLDFRGDDCATLEGVVYQHTLVGNYVEFQGRKVSDTPQREPEAWKALS